MAAKGKDKKRAAKLPPKYRDGLDLSEEGRSQNKLYINIICNYDILGLYIFRVVYNSLYRRK